MSRTAADEIEMMLDPNKWPQWPVLPVKKYSPEGGFSKLETGILWAEKKPTVYLVNMFNMPDDLSTADHINYENFESLVDAGWVVD